jgi:anaerobic dimethyl sulfoxide reductase subunit B (iron-sulfur subunit)
MTAQYAFHFDSTFCSGCKACQAACKDKNNLPPGVLWRRVYEVSGGGWQNVGKRSSRAGTYDVWENTVFAYNLSMACNHCIHPKCAGVCPVDAYTVREDGIVYLDTTKCMGCGYCAWACPYAAPQYNPEAGHMTKCDFCCDNLDAGLPPACVAACPLRVLDYVEVNGEQRLDSSAMPLWLTSATEHPYPLPIYSRTRPHLAIKLHPSMSVTEEKFAANREEVQPRRTSKWEEAPLMGFTLLGQMAVGGFWAMQWMFPQWWKLVEHEPTFLRFLPSLLIGLCLGAGMFTSFAHLGTKRNAWRVLAHLRKSWLSREVLYAGLFGAGWLVTTLESAIWHHNTAILTWLTALLGFGLVYSMSQVYRLPSVPAWDTWRTTVCFMLSALLLGLLGMASVWAYEAYLTGLRLPPGQWAQIGISTLALLALQLAIAGRYFGNLPANKLRIGLILAGVIGTAIIFLIPGFIGVWPSLAVFLVVLAEEAVGRWLFYQLRVQAFWPALYPPMTFLPSASSPLV